MTTRAESEILTRVGAGALVGDLMREYWIPAAQSSELKAGEPVNPERIDDIHVAVEEVQAFIAERIALSEREAG